METVMIEPIRKEITVACTPQAAFDIFVRKISDWWPKGEHSVSAMQGGVARNVMLEPKEGGRLYEISHEGEEIAWGSVKTFEDGARLVLKWHINEPATKATEVDVTFLANGSGGTQVVLVHREFERLGDDGAGMREGYNKGWVNVFENHFAQACAA